VYSIICTLQRGQVVDSTGTQVERGAGTVVTIRAATQQDISEVIAVHKAAFPGFLPTMLGDGYLLELYQGFLQNFVSIWFIASHNSHQMGLVAGTTEPAGFFKRLLLYRWPSFNVAGASSFFRHPLQFFRRFLVALVYRGEKPHGVVKATLQSSIGVSPHYAGRGVGLSLVEHFCREAFSRGADHVYLLTDDANNDAANHSYVKCGFSLGLPVLRLANKNHASNC
jgi:ribosomal protein S18 acetylase RimI-like enzyme